MRYNTKQQFKKSFELGSINQVSPSEAALQQKLANNPVYRAFENVHDVDDLYRLDLSFNSKKQS